MKLSKIIACTFWLSILLVPQAAICQQSATKPTVGVYYFPGWYRASGETYGHDNSKDWSEWRGAIAKAPYPRPLCGFYDDSDPRLWSYYIKWMTSHGINFIGFDWYYNDKQDYIYESLDRGFLGNKSNQDIDFCLTWCNHGGYWWDRPLDQSKPALIEMIDRASARYFYRPNYLKIDGKPVFMVYDSDILMSFGGIDGAKAGIQAMRECARKNGYPDLYLVGIYSSNSASYIDILKELGYDAFCAYNYAGMRGAKVNWNSVSYPYSLVVDNVVDNIHPFLAKVGKEKGITYWPTVFAGWDDRPRSGLEKSIVLTDNNPQEFGRMMQSGVKNIDPSSPVVILEAWNEWGEGACIEPSKKYGFGYLQEISKALGITAGDESLPSKDEILSWSALSPSEVDTAQKNEAKEWPVKDPVLYKYGKSYSVRKAKMPVVVSFEQNKIAARSLMAENLKAVDCDKEGLVLEVTGNCPRLHIKLPKIQAAQIKKIVLEAEVLDSAPEHQTPVLFEIFFKTALMPDCSAFASAHLPPLENGKTSILTSNIMSWEKFGTPVTGIRLDFGSGVVHKVRLKRLTILDK
ncbi:MAG: glycoside hydrolase family 99-like domain-containing protein [Armatimonadota bacterium]